MKKRKKVMMIGALILCIALIFGIYDYIISSRYESTDDAFLDGHIIPISAKISGHVQKVYIRDNQWVKAGELLVEIDPQDFQVHFEKAQAALKSAEAEEKKTIKDLDRYRQLRAREEVSEQEIDLIRTASVTRQQNSKVAAAELKQAELNLSYTKINAPEMGRITRKSVEEGAYVQVGQPLLALVPSDLWVTANFKENQIKNFKIGQKVEIEIDAFPDKTFKGHIESIQAGSGARFSLFPPENATGNFVKVVQRVPVKIVFDEPTDPSHPLGPGMSVKPKVRIK